MRKTVSIPIDKVIPSTNAVLKGQGIPEGAIVSKRINQLAQQSISIYKDLSQPAGILMEISKSDFETVYYGEDRNEAETPVENIYQTSDNLALFAVTIGEKICREIARLFEMNEFALGSMLDSAASEGAEMASQFVELYYKEYLKDNNLFDSSSGILCFSPGYCGWYISAQRKLFEFLHPDEIGIRLGESFLMTPLKSISGVIIAGAKEIFEFDDVFPFCGDCETHSCRDRIKAIFDY